MEIKEFIENFAGQFDETAPEMIEENTRFRDLEEWSSLTGLATLIMVDKAYGVKLTLDEFKKVETVRALFDMVQANR